MRVLYIHKTIESCNNVYVGECSDRWFYGELPESTTVTFTNFNDAYDYINKDDHVHVSGIYTDKTCFRHRKYIAIYQSDFTTFSTKIFEKDFQSFSHQEVYKKIDLYPYDTFERLQKKLSATDFISWYKDNMAASTEPKNQQKE